MFRNQYILLEFLGSYSTVLRRCAFWGGMLHISCSALLILPPRKKSVRHPLIFHDASCVLLLYLPRPAFAPELHLIVLHTPQHRTSRFTILSTTNNTGTEAIGGLLMENGRGVRSGKSSLLADSNSWWCKHPEGFI